MKHTLNNFPTYNKKLQIYTKENLEAWIHRSITHIENMKTEVREYIENWNPKINAIDFLREFLGE